MKMSCQTFPTLQIRVQVGDLNQQSFRRHRMVLKLVVGQGHPPHQTMRQDAGNSIENQRGRDGLGRHQRSAELLHRPEPKGGPNRQVRNVKHKIKEMHKLWQKAEPA